MISLKMDGLRVTMTASGTIGEQMDELLHGVHAWYDNTAEAYPELRERLRGALLDAIRSDAFWEAKPVRKYSAVEVDSPEELFDDLGGD